MADADEPTLFHHTSIQTEGNSHASRECVHTNTEIKGSCIAYRYLMAFLIFWGFFLAQAARSSFNIALVAMVNFTAEDFVNQSANDCPETTPDHNHTVISKDGDFNWDDHVQGLLLSGFFYGYVITQFPGGYLAERFGGKWVFGLNILLPGLLSLLHPILAKWDYRVLLATRVLMGLTQGPVYPTSQAIWGKWAPPLERSRLVGISATGGVLGLSMSMILTGYLCSLSFLGGWPLTFYLLGGASCLWFICWAVLAADSPRKGKYISQSEVLYIEGSLGQDHHAQAYSSPPWKSILTSRPLWSLAVFALCDGISYYVIFSGVPLYMKQVLRFNIAENGALNALPFLASMLVSLVAGPIADYILTKRYLSITTTRKLLSCIGEMCTALAMVGIGLADCDHMLVITFLIVGFGLNGMNAAGVFIVTVDMAPQYAGILLGMTNVAQNIGGFLSPMFVSSITHDQPNKNQWQIVFYVAAGVYALGTVIFWLLGSAEIQPWAREGSVPDAEETEVDITTHQDHLLSQDSQPLLT